MYKLVVRYPEPTDRDAFRSHYEDKHLPLVWQLPGLRSASYSLDVTPLDGDGPYFGVFEAEFASEQDMATALASPQGQAVAADVPNYATGGAHLSHHEVRSVGPDGRALILDYLDRWNAHDVQGIVAMFADAGRYTDPSLNGRQVRGDELVEHLTGLFGAVPDLTLDISAAAQDGPRRAIAFWQMTGTGPGPHPSTNNGQCDFLGGDIVYFNDDGKITWTAALYDQKVFAEQGGLIPPA